LQLRYYFVLDVTIIEKNEPFKLSAIDNTPIGRANFRFVAAASAGDNEELESIIRGCCIVGNSHSSK
jgi:hypothetical protein